MGLFLQLCGMMDMLRMMMMERTSSRADDSNAILVYIIEGM
jgi:hypothetical protein